MSRISNLDTFTRAYLRAILFTGSDETTPSGGAPLDRNYTIGNFSDESIALAEADCAAFQSIMAHVLDPLAVHDDTDAEQAGHDFWMTRCGHGVGFWDGDWPEPAAGDLDAMAQRFGEQWTVLDDNETIHLSGGASASELLVRYTAVVPFANAETDVAVEVLIHRACALIQLGLDVLDATPKKRRKPRAKRPSARLEATL